MNISGDSNAAHARAYSKSNLDLWDQNLTYIIAYELNPDLNHKIRSLLPQVGLRLTFKNIRWNIARESVNEHWQSLAPSPNWREVIILTQCKEATKDVKVHWQIPITFNCTLRPWRKLRKKHALSLKNEAEIIMRNWFLACSVDQFVTKKNIFILL